MADSKIKCDFFLYSK